MKKVFMIFVAVFLFASCANTSSVDVEPRQESDVIKQYRKQIKDCDDKAEEKSNNPKYFKTNGDMRRVVYEQIECHVNIAKSIIENNYSQDKTEMLKNLDVFIKSTHSVAYDIYYPNSCNAACGIIARLNAVNADLKIIKTYLELLVSRQAPVIY